MHANTAQSPCPVYRRFTATSKSEAVLPQLAKQPNWMSAGVRLWLNCASRGRGLRACWLRTKAQARLDSRVQACRR
jgi:hypothetical protein